MQPRGFAVGNFFLDDFSVSDFVVVVSGRPDFGNVFLADVNVAGKQRLQGNRRVLIIVVADFVKVEKSFGVPAGLSPNSPGCA